MELRAPAITYDFAQVWWDTILRQTERFERLRGRLVGLDDYELLEVKDHGEPRPYWIEKAQAAERAGDHVSAYRSWFLAGWDVYHADGIEPIIDSLERTATAAGYTALARLVAHHKRSIA